MTAMKVMATSKNYSRPGHLLAKRLQSMSHKLIFIFPCQQLIFGLGTPLQLDSESIIIGIFAKIVYDLPGNATDFTVPGVYYSRTQKSRWSIYKILEKVAGLYGFGGKACVMKAICEVASAPFDGKHGLLGQLLQVFFKPSSTEEEYDEYGDREYRAAESLGEQVSGESCHALYPECRRSVLDVFSTVIT
ncbi:uncharacterized protein LOC128873528 [Hylaeus volcanicus]|uniref:uncharacterized protein LOC128873528 n=1 Tax=Hylaeus volcanicus TaxID=313075 RepID=UPI0023B7F20C|nr:uncharacterized protein LOC128873528 [Hylaeus volcanicus]